MQQISAAFHFNEAAPGLGGGVGLSLESWWRAAGDFWWLTLLRSQPTACGGVSVHHSCAGLVGQSYEKEGKAS